jgi:hypothetical protein
VIAVSEGITSLSDKAAFKTFLEAAELESKNISKRTTSSIQRIRAQGGFVGSKAPFGYRIERDRTTGVRKLRENAAEQVIITRILALAKKKYTVKHVTLLLRQRYPQRKWSIEAVKNIIKGTKYPAIKCEKFEKEMAEAVPDEPIGEVLYDEPERISRMRKIYGDVQFYVRWTGGDYTWEDGRTFYEDAPELVVKYLEDIGKKYLLDRVRN